MLHKNELLQELRARIQNGEISKEEVLNQLSLPSNTLNDSVVKNKFFHFSPAKVLYVLGAAIVSIGIIVFLSQVWDEIGSFLRVSLTLGLGMFMAIMGSVFMLQKDENHLGVIFHFIAAILIPSGIGVLLFELDLDPSETLIAVCTAIIFGFYSLLCIIHKHPFLYFLSISSGTALVYSILQIISGSLYMKANIVENIVVYTTIVLGLIYMFLAYVRRENWNTILLNLLNFFGIIAILGAAFTRVYDSIVWQYLYFVLIFGSYFLSIFLKSRTVLLVTSIFLIAHLSFITSEYFADSLGWPISLILLGFIFIGLGYASLYINKTYMKKSA